MDWTKTLVVSTFTHPFYGNVPFLRELYDLPHIVFYGDEMWPTPPEVLPFDGSDHTAEKGRPFHGGYFAYRAMLHAVRNFPDFDGYLFLMDDVLMSRHSLAKCDPNRVHASLNLKQTCDVLQPTEVDRRNWAWWDHHYGLAKAQEAYPHFSARHKANLAAATGKPSLFRGGANDCFHLPKRLVEDFVEVFTIMSEHRVFTELAITSGLPMLDECDEIRLLYDPYGRKKWKTSIAQLYGVLNPAIRGIHPVKFSTEERRKWARTFKRLGCV